MFVKTFLKRSQRDLSLGPSVFYSYKSKRSITEIRSHPHFFVYFKGVIGIEEVVKLKTVRFVDISP